MGQLTDLGFPTDTVKLPKGVLTLRGLCLDDVLQIARIHGEAFNTLFEKFTGGDAPEIDLENSAQIAGIMVDHAPNIAASIIAYAADDPDAAEVARRFPFPLQIECLEKIGALTFIMEGGPKKLLETVIRITGGATKAVAELRQPTSG